MTTYLLIKWLHILSSTVLFGTGIGIAFSRWITDRSKNIKAIRIVAEHTVLADWIFTTPAVIAQPLTGFALVYLSGYSLSSGWIFYTFVLYVIAGCCWIPVVWLQLRMRAMARLADDENHPLPERYWAFASLWFWLGVPAFSALVAVYGLMVFKPNI